MPYLGFDLGGTKLSAVLLGDDGEVLRLGYQAVTDARGFLAAVKGIREVLDGRGVSAAGVGLPAWIDPHSHEIRRAPHRRWLMDFDVTRHVQEILGIPIRMGNDANLAALAEVREGSLAGVASGALVNFGTGVGAAIVIDGEVFEGWVGAAGELGHCFFGGEELCECGALGCAELALRANFIAPSDSWGVAEVKQSAYLEVAARLLGWLIRITNPSDIVVGGGVLVGWSDFITRLEQGVATQLSPNHGFVLPQVRGSSFGEYSGAVGAAVLAREPT